jgi:hypothetical protein
MHIEEATIMKRFSPEPNETISLEVESSVVWEVILGISGYTYEKLRHTFDLDEVWTSNQTTMPDSLLKHLKVIKETNFWYGLIMLQNILSASSIQDFSNDLSKIPIDCFYDTLLPYKDRKTEPTRKATANKYTRSILFEQYATHFENHEYLGEYVRRLGQYSYQEICDLFNHVLKEWYEWVSQRDDWEKYSRALAFEQKRNSSIDTENPIEEIERITGGIKYLPEPSIWTVKLIPHVSYRPWILELRTPDTKLFFYPMKDEYLNEPGIPGSELVRGHKALGDELRLKLLYQLLKGPLALQEMSVQFNTSKTTLHHQLSLLKAANFVRVDKGIYSANLTQINSFSGQLTQYLGEFT